MPIFEWDAPTYATLPLPHLEWGAGVLRRLAPRSGEVILDLGCGPGRDAERLLELHPGVEVVGVDGSTRMLAEFDRRFAGKAGARSVHADLTEALTPERLGLARPADAVFSVACFHWIRDHAALFRTIAAVLRPDGRLVAECGGAGNVSRVSAAIAEVKGGDPEHWAFEDAETTRRDLEAAGFAVEDVRLRPDPLVLDDRHRLETYLATVVLGNDLTGLPADEQRGYVAAVADRLPDGVLDYVRLEFEARRR